MRIKVNLIRDYYAMFGWRVEFMKISQIKWKAKTTMANTIKIMQPVMQEVEISREELLKKLLRGAGSNKFSSNDLVNIKHKATGLTYNVKDDKDIETYGAVKVVNQPTPFNPWTGQYWSAGATERKVTYQVSFFDCNSCIKTLTFAEDELSLLE